MIQLKNDSLLLPGDIFICKGNGVVAKIISTVTAKQKITGKTVFSHTAQMCGTVKNKLMIDEQKKGIIPMTYDNWREKYNYKYDIFRPIYSEFDVDEWNKKCLDKSGVTPYEFKALFKYLWYMKTGIWIGRDNENDDRMYCSDFTGYLLDYKDHWQLSPQQIFELLFKDLRYLNITKELDLHKNAYTLM